MNSPPRPSRACAPGHDVLAEHVVLLRHLACLQTRVSGQTHDQLRRCDALEAELLRWRARWVIATSQLLWGLGWPGLGATAAELARRDAQAARHQDGPAHLSATDVLCQSGCASHAHAWRSEEGQCQLTGAACTRVPPRLLESPSR